MIKIKKISSQINNIFKYSLLLFLILSFIYLAMSSYIMITKSNYKKAQIVKNEETLVNVTNSIISVKLNRVISDLKYMSDVLDNDYFQYNDVHDIEKEWVDFSNRKKIYDQIRYIDIDGNEVIRVNNSYTNNGAYLVKSEDLQNKKDKEYFKSALLLKKEQVYISKFDLNMENGEVEKPLKPTIRFSMPVFDKNSELAGVIVINYYAQYLLDDIERISSTGEGEYFFLNSDGYWIYNSMDKTKQWTFMFDDMKEISFKSEFPQEWEIMSDAKSGSFSTEKGYFSYTNVIPDNELKLYNLVGDFSKIGLGDNNWIFASYISTKNSSEEVFFTKYHQYLLYIINTEFVAFIVILILSVSFSLLLSFNKISKEKILFYSEYDAMTGIFNRRAGYKLLEKSYHDTMRTNGHISVCFIDINGLKDVNDNLGHDAGDELILTIVGGIKKHIRQDDFVSRLGGDEFLIVFVNTNQGQAEEIWERIRNEYDSINTTENREYVVSASHGTAEFNFDSNEYIDSIINSADEKMYVEKRKIKQDLKVIRQTDKY